MAGRIINRLPWRLQFAPCRKILLPAIGRLLSCGDKENDMLNQGQAKRAADLLMRHWSDGTRLAHLPDDLKPATRAEGYAIQAHFMAHSASPLFGWKIAATSTAGQRHINVDAPLAGRLLAEKVCQNGATLALASNRMRVAEVEFAFRFGVSLPPRAKRYSADEVLAAVATLHPAIEIPDSRYEDFCAVGAPQLIADNACAHQFILGPAATGAWRQVDLSGQKVFARVEGKSDHQGIGANALGDPRIALTWIVNELSGLDIAMEAGQVVTTGTCVTPVAVAPGDSVLADYGPFGALSVRFS
jgi:2-keto-4-pentenoate hydratase